MPTTSRLAPAALFAAAAALSGCATTPAPAARPFAGPHEITILFKADPAARRDCPVSVTVKDPKKQCLVAGKPKADCLDTGPTQTVVFVAEEIDSPAGSGELEFSLDFDPFHKGNNPFKGKKGQALTLRLDPDSPYKSYTYNVFSGTCPVLDPQIIIREP